MATPPGNVLCYGDNLQVLREHVEDNSVDLVYLDPPFKSDATYNVLFKEREGQRAAAQFQVFEDTWHWDTAAAEAFDEAVSRGGRVADALLAFRQFLAASDMLAYLSMMAPRLLELRRVLRSTGSLYLHCDPAASHYLKMLLDAVFGPENFRSEVVWQRTSAHSSAKRYGPVHDVIFFYTKSDTYTWNVQYTPYSEQYLEAFYTHIDSDGRRWRRSDLTGAGVRNGETGKRWRGIDVTAKGRHWAYPPDELDRLDRAGRIHWPAKKGGMPMYKRYADEMPGVPLQDMWSDISPLHNLAAERLGYQTQKPEALLERILCASSNPGDTVLDPFCGCGTAVSAAQRLGRRWIGIDITRLAVNLIKTRLRDAYGAEVRYTVVGEPTHPDEARDLAHDDPYQFQWWALGLVGARPVERKKGADRGIDGRLYFRDGSRTSQLHQIIISVKAGHVQVAHVRDLRGVLARERAAMGVLISLEPPTRQMRQEAATAGYVETAWGKHARIQLLTIDELFDGRAIDYPRTTGSNVTFQQAPRATRTLAIPQDLFADGLVGTALSRERSRGHPRRPSS